MDPSSSSAHTVWERPPMAFGRTIGGCDERSLQGRLVAVIRGLQATLLSFAMRKLCRLVAGAGKKFSKRAESFLQ